MSAQVRVEEFSFTEPARKIYRLELPLDEKGNVIASRWLRVVSDAGGLPQQEFGCRIVVELHPGHPLDQLPVAEAIRRNARGIGPNAWILHVEDAYSAAQLSARIASLPWVRLCHPDTRFQRRSSSTYSTQPNDEKYWNLWHLEARNADGSRAGADINAREAWAISRGEGILIAVGDDGLEVEHPDLAAATAGQPHFNFENGTSNVIHSQTFEHHGTSVAGLAAARGDNHIGMAGAAPRASLAGWKMLNAASVSVFEMFQYESNRVDVQNHSWSFGLKQQRDMPDVEKRGLTNAVTHGRAGKGVVVVRASGNNRRINPSDVGSFPAIAIAGNANDDGYVKHPMNLCVAAVRVTGRVADYSTPGACVLTAAGSGETGFPTLFTTDRSGNLGRNTINCIDFTNCWDYIFNASGFVGTSGSSPIVAGVAALVLGANTNLHWRDVQQIIALSSRHLDLADTDIQTNGAGLRVSHNVGYGVADAGEATRLALLWTNRPARREFRYVQSMPSPVPIPDFGNIVRASGSGVPIELNRIQGWFPDLSLHPDDQPGEWRPPNLESASLPLTHVGLADQDIATDLSGQAALIERGQIDFIDKLNRAQSAGAAFAIVYNRDRTTPDEAHDPEQLVSMNLQSINTYPAIFIGRTNGLALRDLAATNPATRVQLVREGPRFTFNVTNELICEHVAVRVLTDHPRRRDLHINLYSPSGTRSRLARHLLGENTPSITFFEEAGPLDWTYHSVLHFFEPTAGEWTVQIVDEQAEHSGNVLGVELVVSGAPIRDTDADGLDDDWETTHFGNLTAGPRDDPDHDGYQNAKEQALGTNPNVIDAPFNLRPDLSLWTDRLARFSWPGSTNFTYSLETATNAVDAFQIVTNVPAVFPVTETFLPYTNDASRIFRVRATPVTQ